MCEAAKSGSDATNETVIPGGSVSYITNSASDVPDITKGGTAAVKQGGSEHVELSTGATEAGSKEGSN